MSRFGLLASGVRLVDFHFASARITGRNKAAATKATCSANSTRRISAGCCLSHFRTKSSIFPMPIVLCGDDRYFFAISHVNGCTLEALFLQKLPSRLWR